MRRVSREAGERPARSRHCEWGATPESVTEATGNYPGRPGDGDDPRVRRPDRDALVTPFREKRSGRGTNHGSGSTDGTGRRPFGAGAGRGAGDEEGRSR